MNYETGLKALVEYIVEDYAIWSVRSFGPESSAETCDRAQEFRSELRIESGRSYDKVIKGGSVWGFIVKSDKDKKFKKGDILKAASWKAPARNVARGNIMDEDFSWVRWTGPAYL